MTTSGSYDRKSTMSEIIYDAFSLINVIDDGETMQADQWNYGRRMLNDFINMFSVHPGLWLKSKTTVTLTPGTTSYAVGVGETIDIPKPMQIREAWRETGGYEIPISVEPRSEYMGIPNKTLQAPPTLIYLDLQRDTGTLYVWPTGTATDNTIIIDACRPIQDFDTEGNNPDLPREWMLALKYQLAVVLAPKYKGTVVPADIKIMADQYLNAIIENDEEKTSVFF